MSPPVGIPDESVYLGSYRRLDVWPTLVCLAWGNKKNTCKKTFVFAFLVKSTTTQTSTKCFHDFFDAFSQDVYSQLVAA